MDRGRAAAEDRSADVATALRADLADYLGLGVRIDLVRQHSPARFNERHAAK